jgi:ECF sigma factor
MARGESGVASGAPGDITDLLVAWAAGDRAAPEKLMPLVYGELRRLARRHLRTESVKLIKAIASAAGHSCPKRPTSGRTREGSPEGMAAKVLMP